MKKQEKYLNRKVIPLKNNLASLSNRYQASIARITDTQESYIEDVRTIHQLCEVVSKLPEDRIKRNEDLIKTDLTALVNQANPKEEVLIAAKDEFETSVGGVRDTVKEMALLLKKIQIDTTALDYEMMVRADSALADILVKIIAVTKSAEIKIDEIMNLGFDQVHKQKIEDEYQRRDGGKNYLYQSSWRPFGEQIKEFNNNDDAQKVTKLFRSFQNLLDAIEWSFDAEHFEHGYIPVINNMYRMQDLILAKTQELEYAKVRPDDCAHPLTQEFIKFYHKLYGHIVAVIAELFYEHPAHRDLMEVLRIRVNFFEDLRLAFGKIREKFLENKKNYQVQEFWDTLSSMIFDFMERIYTSNVHQKLKINELVRQIVIDARRKIEYIVKEIALFHESDIGDLKTANVAYTQMIVDEYNSYLTILKSHFRTIKIQEGYQIEFKNEFMNFTFNEFMANPGLDLKYSLILSISPPESGGSGPWILPADPGAAAPKQQLKAELDAMFKFFVRSDYNYVKVKSFKVPEYNMEDYVNMFVRPRVIKCNSKYYETFNHIVMEKTGEKLISLDKPQPPIEEGALKNGYGIHKVTITKEKPMSVKIPFFPPTFTTIQTNYFCFLSTKEMYHFIRTNNKGIPGADSFFIITVFEVKEQAEPKCMIVEVSYAIVFVASSMVEGTVKQNAPIEIANSVNAFEAAAMQSKTENDPKVDEQDPNKPKDSNNVYDKKMLHTAQFKNLKDKSDEIFASPAAIAERKRREELAKRRRYLGEYDKRAIYHAGPEAFNPEYEDIFNVRTEGNGALDKVVEYVGDLKDKNLGLLEEVAEKNKDIVQKYVQDPDKLMKDVKENIKDWRVQVTIGVIILLIILKIFDY